MIFSVCQSCKDHLWIRISSPNTQLHPEATQWASQPILQYYISSLVSQPHSQRPITSYSFMATTPFPLNTIHRNPLHGSIVLTQYFHKSHPPTISWFYSLMAGILLKSSINCYPFSWLPQPRGYIIISRLPPASSPTPSVIMSSLVIFRVQSGVFRSNRAKNGSNSGLNGPISARRVFLDQIMFSFARKNAYYF